MEEIEDQVFGATMKVGAKKLLVVVHRGTDFGTEDMNVALSDWSKNSTILTGHRFKQAMSGRLEATEALIKEEKPDLVDVTGHSLGGASAAFALSQSELLRSKLRFAALFNEGNVAPILDNKIAQGTNTALHVSANVKRFLDGRVVHYRHQDDLVSAGLMYEVPFGKVANLDGNTAEAMRWAFLEDVGREAGKSLADAELKKRSAQKKADDVLPMLM